MRWKSFKETMKDWAEVNQLKYEDLSDYKYGDRRIEIEGNYKQRHIKISCNRYAFPLGEIVIWTPPRAVFIELDHHKVYPVRPLTTKRIESPKAIKKFIDAYIENGNDISQYSKIDYLILTTLLLAGLIIGIYLLSLNW